MEILAELLVFLLELFGEAALQLLVELGARSLVAPFRREGTLHPGYSAAGYVFFGALMGGLSLLVFPDLFVRSKVGRVANLVLTPLLSGAAMAGLRLLRERRGKTTILLDRFAYGFLFALAMGGVRFAFGH